MDCISTALILCDLANVNGHISTNVCMLKRSEKLLLLIIGCKMESVVWCEKWTAIADYSSI